MNRVMVLVCLVGCGIDGDPIKGDVAMTYGSDHPKLAVGAVVQHRDTPGNMLVQIGSDNVDCDTYLDVFFSLDTPDGHFVYFDVDKATPGTHSNASVSVMHSDGNHTSTNISNGTVVIDAIGSRVTGSVTFSTTDQDVGTISVSGSFDVRNCL